MRINRTTTVTLTQSDINQFILEGINRELDDNFIMDEIKIEFVMDNVLTGANVYITPIKE